MSASGDRGWYLRRGRYQVGPFPVDEIAHLLQGGRIAEGDFARRSGTREWFPAIRLRDEIGWRVQMVTGEGRVRDLLITEFVIN